VAKDVRTKTGKGPGLIVRTAMRYGMTRGLLGGSRGWLWVGGAAWTYNKLVHRKRASSDLVYSEDVSPGQWVEVRVVPPPPTRKERRRAAKQARKAAEHERKVAASAARSRRA
jgi:hypothetical protein